MIELRSTIRVVRQHIRRIKHLWGVKQAILATKTNDWTRRVCPIISHHSSHTPISQAIRQGNVFQEHVTCDQVSVSLRRADVFPAVASLPPSGGREASTGNTSALRRLTGCIPPKEAMTISVWGIIHSLVNGFSIFQSLDALGLCKRIPRTLDNRYCSRGVHRANILFEQSCQGYK